MEIHPPLAVSIIKKKYDQLHLHRLKEATQAISNQTIGVVVMEEGVAHIFYVGQQTATLKAKIEKSIPKNKKYNDQQKKAKNRFFELIMNGIEAHLQKEQVKVIAIGSPGFTKE